MSLVVAAALFLSPYALIDIPQAVPQADATRLKTAGVATTDDLLAHGATDAERKKLAQTAQVPRKQLDSYVFMADLLRIRGVGPEMVKLFAAARVHTSRDLARQEAGAFYKKLIAANDKLKISQNPPEEKSVASWIEAAKQLPAVVK